MCIDWTLPGYFCYWLVIWRQIVGIYVAFPQAHCLLKRSWYFIKLTQRYIKFINVNKYNIPADSKRVGKFLRSWVLPVTDMIWNRSSSSWTESVHLLNSEMQPRLPGCTTTNFNSVKLGLAFDLDSQCSKLLANFFLLQHLSLTIIETLLAVKYFLLLHIYS